MEAPCELQACFDGLGAAVAEEGARQPRQPREALGHLSLQRVEKEVRRVEQLAGLFAERDRQLRMRMAERGNADAGEEVEILAPAGVDQP